MNLYDLKDRHRSKRAFVIGNGPSLRMEDLDLLVHEISFACNKIYLAFENTSWRPTYYTVEDHLVAQQCDKKIEQLEGVVKFFPHTLALHGLHFSDSIEYPFIWKDVYPEAPGFSNDAVKGLYWGSTVVYTMMQMACYMGIKVIYLLGVDFNFIIPGSCAESTGKFKVYISEGEQNHFHPNYRNPGEQWHQPNLEYQRVSFLAARKFAKENGVNIYNATRGGNLEIFPRIKLQDIF